MITVNFIAPPGEGKTQIIELFKTFLIRQGIPFNEPLDKEHCLIVDMKAKINKDVK